MFKFNNPEQEGIILDSFEQASIYQGRTTASFLREESVRRSFNNPFNDNSQYFQNYFTKKPFSTDETKQIESHLRMIANKYSDKDHPASLLLTDFVSQNKNYVRISDVKEKFPNTSIDIDHFKKFDAVIETKSFFGKKDYLIDPSLIPEIRRSEIIDNTIQYNEFIKPFAQYDSSLRLDPKNMSNQFDEASMIKANLVKLMDQYCSQLESKPHSELTLNLLELDKDRQDVVKSLAATFIAQDLGINSFATREQLRQANLIEQERLEMNTSSYRGIQWQSDKLVMFKFFEENKDKLNGKFPEENTPLYLELKARQKEEFTKLRQLAEKIHSGFKQDYNKEVTKDQTIVYKNPAFEAFEKIGSYLKNIASAVIQTKVALAIKELTLKLSKDKQHSAPAPQKDIQSKEQAKSKGMER